MKLVVKGHLNSFYKPASEGGKGLPNWIMLNVFNTVSEATNNDIYLAIQASDLTNGAKDLSKSQIKTMFTWMIGKEIEDKILVQSSNDTATYEYLDAFGCPSQNNIEGISYQLQGYKPDGSQVRWGIAYPVAADTDIFSSIHATQPTITGVAGQTYTLLMSCNSSGQWLTKEITAGFVE